jgi:hypothetical protein
MGRRGDGARTFALLAGRWGAVSSSRKLCDEAVYLFRHRQRWPNYLLIFLIIAGEAAIAIRVWKFWTTVR